MDRRSGNGGQFISLVLLGSDGSGGESHDSSAVRGKILQKGSSSGELRHSSHLWLSRFPTASQPQQHPISNAEARI